jgi:hypothetical protein
MLAVAYRNACKTVFGNFPRTSPGLITLALSLEVDYCVVHAVTRSL